MILVRKLVCLIAFVVPLAPGWAFAESGQSRLPELTFSAFGTLGVVHSSNDQADFTSGAFAPNGAGYSHTWSPDLDSRVGGQVQASFNSRLSAVLQVTSEQRYDNTYRPKVEWANIKYQLSPDLSLRVGRTVIPVFLVSDSRKIGYGIPWVRPPLEVYSEIPITSSDGVDGTYRFHFGDFTNTLTGTYGQTNANPPGAGAGEAQVRRQSVIADQLEFGATTLHFSYSRSHLTFVGLGPFFDAFRQFGPQGAAIADQYGTDNRLVQFVAVGGQYDPGKWFVTAEWASINFHSFLGKRAAWFASSGYRLGMFTPYLTYAHATAGGNSSDPGIDAAAFPASQAGLIAGLNAALNANLDFKPIEDTSTIGVRWDFWRNLDLKLQYDHMNLGSGSVGPLINVQPGFVRGGNVNLFSATIDFVL